MIMIRRIEPKWSACVLINQSLKAWTSDSQGIPLKSKCKLLAQKMSIKLPLTLACFFFSPLWLQVQPMLKYSFNLQLISQEH